MLGLVLSCLYYKYSSFQQSGHKRSVVFSPFYLELGAEGPATKCWTAAVPVTAVTDKTSEWENEGNIHNSEKPRWAAAVLPSSWGAYLALSSSSPAFHYLDLWPLTVSPTVQRLDVLPPSYRDLRQKGTIIWSVMYEKRCGAITGCFPAIVDGCFRFLVLLPNEPWQH